MFIYDSNYFYNRTLLSDETVVDSILLNKHYNEYYIPKKNGSRTIHSLDRRSDLYTLQKKLKGKLLDSIPLSNCTYGFVKGYSV